MNADFNRPMTLIRTLVGWIVETERDLRSTQSQIDQITVRF